MPRSSPTLTPALQTCIQHAFLMARAARHEYLTLEHLLLALQEDPFVRQAVEACGGKPAELKTQLEAFLKDRLEALPSTEDREPVPTLGFKRVMERAIVQCRHRFTVFGGWQRRP